MTWDGGGATNNWSEAANWSGGTVPGAGDVAVFDGTSTKDATIDAAFAGSVAGIQINSGYTGTITHASGATLTVGGSGFVQSAGTFTGGVNNIDCNSTFTLNGGTFNAPSGTLAFAGDVTIKPAATFIPNGGTVAFTGSSSVSINPANPASASSTLNNITVNKTGGAVVLLNSTTLVATGTLTLTDGRINVNNGGTIEAQGAVSIASTFDGGNATLLISGAATRTVTLPVGAGIPALTVNAPNVTLNASGAPGTITFSEPLDIQSAASFTNGAVNFIFSNAFAFGAATNFTPGSGDLTFNNTFTQTGGTFTAGSGALNFNSTFTLNGGTFNAPSGTLAFAGDVTIKPAATFNPNGGTVAFTGSSSVSINPANPASASSTLNNITVNKTGGAVVLLNSTTLVATGMLTLTDGRINVNNGGTIEAQGEVSIASTFDGGNATLLISGAATRTVTLPVGAGIPALTVNAPNVTLNASGAPGTITFSEPLDVQSAASFTNGAVNFVFSRPFTLGAVDFTPGSGDLTFNSSFTQTGGTFGVGSGALNFNSTFTLNGGTFNAPSGILTFASNVTIAAAATFNPNGGTVAFAGSLGATLTVPASLTLNNITVNKTDGVVVFINSTSTLVATGTLSLTDGRITVNNGATIDARGAVSIASTFDGSQADLSFSGSANQTFTNNGGANPTGTWTINKTSGKVTLASNLILSNSQPLNITSGTLDQGASFNLQTSNTLTIGAAGTLRDFGTGDLTLGSNLINNGVFNFNGGGTNCSDPNVADQILIRSSSSGTTRAWSGGGTFSVVDVDVQDQDASAIAGGITAFGSSVINNSLGWTTNSGCPIAVTTQPLNASACPGSSASFTAAVSGPGPTFQWRKNGAPLSDGGNISGALSATLTINPVSAGDVASSPGYDAIGTNSFGVTATTAAATLSLKSAPAITADPAVTTVCAGQLASFSASATGDGLTFHWRRNGSPLSNGGAISGADTPTLTINPTVAGDDANYDLVVNGDCTPPAVSSAAHLTVNAAPKITTEATDQEACAAGSANFSVATTGTGLSFQWRRNGVSLNDGGNISGAHTATLTISPAAAGDAASAGVGYDVIVSGTCTPAVTSIRRALTIDDAPAIGTEPADQEVASGAAASFSVGATGASLTFQWRRNGTNLSDGGNISGAHTATLTINPVGAGDAAVAAVGYDVVVSGTCSPSTTSGRRALTVDAPSAADGEVSGRITTTDGAPLSGVVIRLTGTQNRKTITDSNGNYRFSEVETSGFYTVVPARTDYAFSPATRSFSQLGNQTEAAFTASSSGVTANPLDTPEYFVRQQYLDVLGREPDESGFNYWSDQLLACTDANCIRAQRIGVAAAFFIEPEAQQTGSYIYDLYAGTLNRKPAFAEYSVDRQQVVGGANLEAQKTAFAQSFVQRAEFAARYQANTTAESFVDALLQNVQSSGGDLSGERTSLIGAYNAGASLNESRASVLRAIADNAAFKQTQYNAAFVLTEYFGYLRRDAETDGFNFWLNVLNNSDPRQLSRHGLFVHYFG